MADVVPAPRARMSGSSCVSADYGSGELVPSTWLGASGPARGCCLAALAVIGLEQQVATRRRQGASRLRLRRELRYTSLIFDARVPFDLASSIANLRLTLHPPRAKFRGMRRPRCLIPRGGATSCSHASGMLFPLSRPERGSLSKYGSRAPWPGGVT